MPTAWRRAAPAASADHAKSWRDNWRELPMRRHRPASHAAAMNPQTTRDLIEIGRDREAATNALGGPMNGVQQLEQVAPLLGALVGNIGDADLGRPTPCAAFDVAGVLE